MDTGEILAAFNRKFGKLKDFGLKNISIVNSWDYDEINCTTPFIFDRRKLPDEFMGLTIKAHVDELPAEFTNLDKADYIWSYQRFEEFVDKYPDLIRKKLKETKMNRGEMLDALCFGNFELHKKNCLMWENDGTIPKWNSPS